MRPTFDIPASPTDPERWIAAGEARFPDIRPGLAKEIVWADPVTKNRTARALIYVHGFSASKEEVRPLPDLVAENLRANLFYMRLAGHGRSNDAMGEVSIQDWYDDMAEALAVAAAIGDRVLLIATSTGAALAALVMAEEAGASRIAAAALLSPNFAIRSRAVWLLTAPFARYTTRLLLGRHRSFQPINALNAANWTTTYPVEALLPMAALVRAANHLPFGSISIPALFIASPRDEVVDAARTAEVARLWGGPSTLLDPGDVGDPHAHVVAGDSLSPDSTKRLAEAVTDWFNKIT